MPWHTSGTREVNTDSNRNTAVCPAVSEGFLERHSWPKDGIDWSNWTESQIPTIESVLCIYLWFRELSRGQLKMSLPFLCSEAVKKNKIDCFI